MQMPEILMTGEDMDLLVRSVPGMEGVVRRRDLPHFFRVNNLDGALFQMIVRETRQMPRAQGLISNTFEDLEGTNIISNS